MFNFWCTYGQIGIIINKKKEKKLKTAPPTLLLPLQHTGRWALRAYGEVWMLLQEPASLVPTCLCPLAPLCSHACSEPCPDPPGRVTSACPPALALHRQWHRALGERGRKEGGGGCLLLSSSVTLGIRVKVNLPRRFRSQENKELLSCPSLLVIEGSNKSSSDILGVGC